MSMQLVSRYINYLAQDELAYELRIRGISEPKTVDKMRKFLRNLLCLEKAEGSVKLCSSGPYAAEVAALKGKFTSLQSAITSFQGAATDSAVLKFRAQLNHLFGRCNRLAIGKSPGKQETRSGFLKSVLEAKALLDQQLAAQANPNTSVEYQIHASTPRETRESEYNAGESEVSDTSESDRSGEEVNPINSRLATAGSVSSQIRPKDILSWGIKFTGTNDLSVAAFLKRVEEYCIAYEIDKKALLNKALFLFEDKAFVWYRAHRNSFRSWNHLSERLRESFLPPDYDEQLWEEIRDRTQGLDETIDVYVACMMNLFSRLKTPVPETLKINTLLLATF